MPMLCSLVALEGFWICFVGWSLTATSKQIPSLGCWVSVLSLGRQWKGKAGCWVQAGSSKTLFSDKGSSVPCLWCGDLSLGRAAASAYATGGKPQHGTWALNASRQRNDGVVQVFLLEIICHGLQECCWIQPDYMKCSRRYVWSDGANTIPFFSQLELFPTCAFPLLLELV